MIVNTLYITCILFRIRIYSVHIIVHITGPCIHCTMGVYASMMWFRFCACTGANCRRVAVAGMDGVIMFACDHRPSSVQCE